MRVTRSVRANAWPPQPDAVHAAGQDVSREGVVSGLRE